MKKKNIKDNLFDEGGFTEFDIMTEKELRALIKEAKKKKESKKQENEKNKKKKNETKKVTEKVKEKGTEKRTKKEKETERETETEYETENKAKNKKNKTEKTEKTEKLQKSQKSQKIEASKKKNKADTIKNEKKTEPKKESKKKHRPHVEGIYFANAKGFGFVRTEESKIDYYIPKEYTKGAFHGDKVLIEVLPNTKGEHKEGIVKDILERELKTIVGVFQKGKNKSFGFVVTDNRFLPDIYVDNKDSLKAKNGDKVVVRITFYGNKDKKPEGKIIEILGKENAPGVDVLSVIRAMGIPEEFDKKIKEYVKDFKTIVSEDEMENRIDLRNELMVTIDGLDAKDLDDAVSLKMEGNMYILGVHIADVSHYVKEGDILDKEAFLRGNSVYLADRVIPMLPVQLSNGICSLNENEDRLAMSCIMTIDSKGEVTDYKISESIIKTNERMNYTSVNKIINGDEVERALHSEVASMLIKMKELSLILRKKRRERGAIDFDIPESEITVDEDGKPIDIKPHEANDATRLIEEFMLIANETVASHMYWQELPFIYRVHETPDMEKIESLSLILQGMGYYLHGDKNDIHPKEIQRMIDEFEGRDERNLVLRLALRSMKQAHYDPECIGHFGLACKQYTHFTSPIRRYPDLIVHRMLKDEINGRMDSRRAAHYEGILSQIATNSSKMERRATEAEREVEKIKKAQYMKDKIYEEYTGIISGVTGFGLYVELPDTVEGMVHISKIPGDYYDFIESKMIIKGERTGRIYSLGQVVKIRVAKVDLYLHTIDFDLIED